jgi:hypothetical protein
MLRLHAKMFVEALWQINRMEAKWEPTDRVVPDPSSIAANLIGLKMECISHGLTETGKKCDRIMNDCHKRPVTFREIVAALKELRERLEDELDSQVFLHLSTQEAEMYLNPTNDWKTAIARFPRIKNDVEDSSRCFAYGSYAAAVFHILLVAEFGVIELAKLVGKAGDRPGWGSLEKVEKILTVSFPQRSPLEQQHSQLLTNTAPLAHAIKDAWRHKISHVDNKLVWTETDFSARTANEIITATRGFMRRLATDLPKAT